MSARSPDERLAANDLDDALPSTSTDVNRFYHDALKVRNTFLAMLSKGRSDEEILTLGELLNQLQALGAQFRVWIEFTFGQFRSIDEFGANVEIDGQQPLASADLLDSQVCALDLSSQVKL